MGQVPKVATPADLAKFELVERPVTLSCVSNPVGGSLISNAMWTGFRVPGTVGAQWNPA